MTDVRQILNAIKEPNLSFHKGEGYWYFVYDDGEGVYETKSVYSCRLNQLSFEMWIEEGKSFVNSIKAKKEI